MAKLTIIVAIFLAILFLVDASVYRTTVLVDEIDDDENPSNQQRCREQFVHQQNLNRCQDYFMREIRGQSRRANEDDAMVGRRDPFSDCCQQIQRMDAQCRCDALTMAIRQQSGAGQLQGHETMTAMRLAEDLPFRCGVSPRRCRFGSRYLD